MLSKINPNLRKYTTALSKSIRSSYKSVTPNLFNSSLLIREAIIRKNIPNSSFTKFLLAVGSAIAFSSYYLLQEDEVKNDATRLISVDEVMKHTSIEDFWCVINGVVYDVTEFLSIHPGGAERILKYAGKDATSEFSQVHATGEVLKKMSSFIKEVGVLDGEYEDEYNEEAITIMNNRRNKPALSQIFNVSDFEHVAKHVLPQSAYYYFATGSSDEFTLRENHYAYSRVFFRPMVLQDIGEPDLSTKLMGEDVAFPFYITAFAGSRFADDLGERNLQRAAYKSNIKQMIPRLISYSLDDFFEGVPGDQKFWFQLHFDTQEDLDNVLDSVKRIESYPQFNGLFLNVDLAALGNREKDSKKRAEGNTGAVNLTSAVDNFTANYPTRFNWSTIEAIRNVTDLPIALKGIQRGEDVVKAAEKGIKAVILSNHGGRQLDFSRPPLEVLAEARTMLKEKNLEDKIEIYVDGGIRRGSDIVKALCLGAKGVGLGRPFLYAMAGYGEEGISKLIRILEWEMKNNMKLLGVDRIEDLNESLIDITNLKLRSPVVTDTLYDRAYEQMPFPGFKQSPIAAK